MKYLFVVLLAFSTAAGAGVLPDPKLTPGATRQISVAELCTTSTSLARHTTDATKKAVYASYGVAPRTAPECTGPAHSCYEIDHLISLELGGADVQANLWPQPYDGEHNAHDKDKVENRLHRLVCSGAMKLEDAQTCIASDWLACAKKVLP